MSETAELCPKCGAELRDGSRSGAARFQCGTELNYGRILTGVACQRRQINQLTAKNAALEAQLAEQKSEGERLRRVELVHDELLEAMHQAQWTVRFLHNCLTGCAKYAYPEQTARRLEEWAALAPCPRLCHHSRHHEACDACRDRQAAMIRRIERREALAALAPNAEREA